MTKVAPDVSFVHAHIANTDNVFLVYNRFWLDGKRKSEGSDDMIWTDGSKMCNLKQWMMTDMADITNSTHNCLSLRIDRR